MARRQSTVADLDLTASKQIVSKVTPTPGFWIGKRIFLTGHTGFKGAWLSLWLNQLGAVVKGYALPPVTTPNLFDLLDIASNCENVMGDIRDRQKLASEIAHFEPEIVFHLAAQPLVRQSYIQPVDTFETNVSGTLNLLDCCRRVQSIKSVLIATTDKVYEQTEGQRSYCEDDPLGGHDPYSASKAAAELVASAYRKSFFDPQGRVQMVTMRAGNIIGGGDWSEDRLIPDCFRAIQNKTRLDIRSPNAVRPWQHVTDALRGYLILAEKLGTEKAPLPATFNFGPTHLGQTTVREIMEMVNSRWQDKLDWRNTKADDAHHEAAYLALDSTRASNFLGWKPAYDVHQSVERTLDWYDFFAKAPPPSGLRQFTLSQISENLSA
jgi:CDP-glucose 4,6-dehydratase